MTKTGACVNAPSCLVPSSQQQQHKKDALSLRTRKERPLDDYYSAVHLQLDATSSGIRLSFSQAICRHCVIISCSRPQQR